MPDRHHRWASESRRINRRTLLRGAALTGAGAGIAALAACSRGSPPSGAGRQSTAPGSAAKQPKRGGVIAHAGGNTVGSLDTEGVGLDPQISQAVTAQGYRLMYQGLLGYDIHTRKVEPELAQKWEQVSPTEVLFHLQPGVKWHDKPPVNGRELTVDDVVYSLNRIRTNDPKFTQRALFANFGTVEAADKSSVRVTTKGPDATVLSYLSADPTMIVAREVMDKYDKIDSADKVVGTGAFLMKTVEPKVGAEYVRNADYWKAGRPYLDGVRTHQFSDTVAAYAGFQGGQIDILYLPGTEVKGYIARQGSGYKPDWFNDETMVQAFPNTKSKPMDDARVTRALRLLVDHDEFISTWAEPLFGRGAYGSIFCTALQPWDLTQEEYGRQLEWKHPKDDAVKEALSLLSAAGYTKDKPLTFELAGRVGGFLAAATELLQAQWTRLGQGAVKATIRQYDVAVSQQVLASRSFTYFVGGNAGPVPDPDAWLTPLYRSGAPLNYMGYSDPALDAMIDKQRTLLDNAQRHATVKETITYLLDRAPSTIPANRYFLNGVKPKVQDFAPEFYINGRQYEWIWLNT